MNNKLQYWSELNRVKLFYGLTLFFPNQYFSRRSAYIKVYRVFTFNFRDFTSYWGFHLCVDNVRQYCSSKAIIFRSYHLRRASGKNLQVRSTSLILLPVLLRLFQSLDRGSNFLLNQTYFQLLREKKKEKQFFIFF